MLLAPLSLERLICRCVALGGGKDEGDAVAQLPQAGHVDDCAGREGVPEHVQLRDEAATPAAVDGVQV
ncbi:unnamed protein product [Miscanthus lutarioriparius]|uniref:Uncharacterized protein n=1 Tax=Miscanthus lutarioriparius TaxID=422564 RepID=A0A811SF14_9POAL|nr:unnamed protein product [Miscanthus lutarioriparius]